MGKAKEPGKGRKGVVATVINTRGYCSVGHETGDQFSLSCHSADGLCGFFYYSIFPKLSVIQFGGSYPWWEDGQTVFEYECPDQKNAVTLRLETFDREE